MTDIIVRLADLEHESLERGIPILGSEKGAWLAKFIKKIKPKKILELGTANGYSGVILGSEGAEVTTIDIDQEIVEEAKCTFEIFRTKAKVMVGEGVQLVKTMAADKSNHGKFDLIFIDFEKKKYLPVLDDCLRLVKKGSYIIADNITMPGCNDFKKAVMTHPQLKTELIDIKDRLSCSKKIT